MTKYPILYKPNTNYMFLPGLGVGELSDMVSCTCTQDPGCYELEFEYPMDGVHYNDIKKSCVVKAVVPPKYDESPQLFYVVHISKPLNRRVTVLCHHISYMLNFIPLKPFSAGNVGELFSKIPLASIEFNPFHFYTNQGEQSITIDSQYPRSIMEILGGSEDSLSENVEGEFVWDNYDITFRKKRSIPNPFHLRYGLNITDLKQEENIIDTITGVVPYWYKEGDEDSDYVLITLPDYVVYSSTYKNFPFKRTVPLDLSSDIDTTIETDYIFNGFDEDGNPKYETKDRVVYPTEDQLREKCGEWMSENKIGWPKITVDVKFKDISKSDEYEYFKDLQKTNLYDKIVIDFPTLDISEEAIITKTVYDVLAQEYISVTIGDEPTSIVERVQTNFLNIEKKVDKNKDDVFERIEKRNNLYRKSQEEFTMRYGDKMNEYLKQYAESTGQEALQGSKEYTDIQIAAIDAVTEEEIERWQAKIDKDISDAKTEVSNKIWSGTGGYVYYGQSDTTPPHTDRILIMDTNNIQTAKSIVQLNKNGIGFSTTGDGPNKYTNAFTIDGKLNASLITTEVLTGKTINSATINNGTLNTLTVNSGTIKSAYIESGIINSGMALLFNYSDQYGASGTVYAQPGSVTTHLTSNPPITWYGLRFLGSVPGTGSNFANDTRSHSVIFDSRNFVVASKELAIGSQHTSGTTTYNAGMTSANMDSDNAHLILMCSKVEGDSNDVEHARIDLGTRYIGVSMQNDNTNRDMRLDTFIAVQGRDLRTGSEAEFYIPASKWG